MSNRTSLQGSVALVSGANRGIGATFVSGLLEAGTQRVYAAARDPKTLAALAQSDARVVPIATDITDDASVQAAAARLRDVDLVVNNAGNEHGFLMRHIGLGVDSAVLIRSPRCTRRRSTALPQPKRGPHIGE